MKVTNGLIIALIFLAGCHHLPLVTGPFEAPEELGRISGRLKEASGLTASLNNPGYLWTINDNGNKPEVFLLDKNAAIKFVCELPGTWNRDWEDIAIGAGPETGKNYIYVGDIGDNKRKHEVEFIYRFPEPLLSGTRQHENIHPETILLKLPDASRDAETLMIDPLTHDLFIVSKREDSVRVYQATYPFTGDTIHLVTVCKLPMRSIVGGSISVAGDEVLLKSYEKIYYWKRLERESIPSLLHRKPIALYYKREYQGEAIAWSLSGDGFYTLSESSVLNRAQLKFYKRR